MRKSFTKDGHFRIFWEICTWEKCFKCSGGKNTWFDFWLLCHRQYMYKRNLTNAMQWLKIPLTSFQFWKIHLNIYTEENVSTVKEDQKMCQMFYRDSLPQEVLYWRNIISMQNLWKPSHHVPIFANVIYFCREILWNCDNIGKLYLFNLKYYKIKTKWRRQKNIFGHFPSI